ncbi:hypothetical protein [Mycobacterium sp. MUNTM1]
MRVNESPAASRQFVASPASVSSTMNELATGKRTLNVAYGLAVGVGLAAGVGVGARAGVGTGVAVGLGAGAAVTMLVAVVWLVYAWCRSRREVLVGATTEGLTIDRWPRDVFSFADATLSPWANMGVALHLRSGSRRFVLGGRDHRIASSTRLEAPPVQAVDAWLWDPEFDELLAVGGRQSGVDARGPAPEEATRCLLFPNPYLAEQMGSFAFLKQLRLQRSLSRPSLVLDVDNDGIRVIDPNDTAPRASASRPQVTATPAIYQPDSVTSGDASTYDYAAVPGLILSIPGVQPVTVGCLDLVGSQFRFSWRGKGSRSSERPAYVVSAADLLTLAEKFGLAPHLEDMRRSPTTETPATPRRSQQTAIRRDHGDTTRPK